MWSPLLRDMQHVDRCWAPDLPGLGDEPPLPRSQRTAEHYCDWVARWISDRTQEPVDVAGYSMGGSIALLLALRHPHLVRSVAACCSSPCWGRGPRRAAAHLFAGLGGRWAMEVFQFSVRWGFARLDGTPAFLREVEDMLRRADRSTMLDLYRNLADLDLRGRLGQLGVPCAVIGGDRDWLAPPSHLRALLQEVPHGEMHLLRGAGHLLCVSHAERFVRILEGFFSRAPAAPRPAQSVGESYAGG